jgi:hypothetical protein
MSRADGVDLDRLADYAAGALDATETADVALLVRTDERWARAHEALVAASGAVRADLRGLAAWTPAEMPADVAARIEDALREAATTSTAHRSVPSLAAARARRQRTRQRFLTGIGAAAATLVLVLCGVAVSRGVLTGQPDSTSAGGLPNAPAVDRGSNEGAAPPAPGAAPDAVSGPLVVATGLNYSRQDLSELTAKPAQGPLPDVALGSAGGKDARQAEVPLTVRDAAPEPLARLTAPPALANCLTAIRAAYPGVPILIDYARYEGRPALIVSVRSNTSTTVVAVGPDCGVATADQIASATVP